MSARIVVPEKRWSTLEERADVLSKESSGVETALGTEVEKERSKEVRVVKRECRVVHRRPAKKLGSDMKVVRKPKSGLFCVKLRMISFRRQV
jgi:hypothetical protein